MYRLGGARKIGFPRRARLALAVATSAGCCAWGAEAGVAAPLFPAHVCGHFFRAGQDFIVYNGGELRCSKATPMIKDFVHGKATQHGTNDADSYWTISAFPGFKCTQSMGEGQCVKGKEIAAYKVKGAAG